MQFLAEDSRSVSSPIVPPFLPNHFSRTTPFHSPTDNVQVNYQRDSLTSLHLGVHLEVNSGGADVFCDAGLVTHRDSEFGFVARCA
jgi:hypothetical protein